MARRSHATHIEFRSLAHDPPLWSRREREPLSNGWKLLGATALAAGLVALVLERQATASAAAPHP